LKGLRELNISELKLKLSALSIYKNVIQKPVVKELHALVFCAGDRHEILKACGALCFAAAAQGCLSDVAKAVSSGILYDENPFSMGICEADELVRSDMEALTALSQITPEEIAGRYEIRLSLLPKWGTKGFSVTPEELKVFYRKNGCGIYARYAAFLWNGDILPVTAPDRVTLQDLKGYAQQRGDVLTNTKAFLAGLPANNILLYGDRGTGKSSTVHAVLNEYRDEGLRIVEMPKRYLSDFPMLIDRLSGTALKFIVFIDDLSFSQRDDSFSALKAVLEGGLSARPDNVLIYATSNRRHLVRETFSDRDGDELHHSDTMQEVLSLSDRFGITITFINPDRQGYFDIVNKLANDRGLMIDRTELAERAERFALSKGGRSPRVAKQLIDILTAEEKLKN